MRDDLEKLGNAKRETIEGEKDAGALVNATGLGLSSARFIDTHRSFVIADHSKRRATTTTTTMSLRLLEDLEGAAEKGKIIEIIKREKIKMRERKERKETPHLVHLSTIVYISVRTKVHTRRAYVCIITYSHTRARKGRNHDAKWHVE